MKIGRSIEVDWTCVSGHRGADLEFKTLLIGAEGTPDNYYLSVYKVLSGFVAPAHRHNFDQIRVGLAGALNYGHQKNILPGEVAYFPEGQYYGPQEQAPSGDSIGLVIQFGGASGQGFMSQKQLSEGFKTLSAKGHFSEGVFRANEGQQPPGSARNRDSYEAIWEEVNGRPIDYVNARYTAPIHMRPSGFAWQKPPAAGFGTLVKNLGVYTERSVELGLIQMSAGAEYALPIRDGITLLYVLDGSGRCNDVHDWAEGTAIEIAAGEQLTLKAEKQSEIFMFGLPIFMSPARASLAA